jgi:hypothetical protein
MKIKVYFGEGDGYLLDYFKPLEQVKRIKKLIKRGKDLSITTISPYVIEAVDTFKKDADVKYFNEGVESNVIEIVSEINQAFLFMEKYRYKK